MCLFSFIVNMDEERMSRSLCKFFSARGEISCDKKKNYK